VRFISVGQAQNSDSHKPPTGIIQKINHAKNDAMSHLVSFFPSGDYRGLKQAYGLWQQNYSLTLLESAMSSPYNRTRTWDKYNSAGWFCGYS
jgi:hypothetical protein